MLINRVERNKQQKMKIKGVLSWANKILCAVMTCDLWSDADPLRTCELHTRARAARATTNTAKQNEKKNYNNNRITRRQHRENVNRDWRLVWRITVALFPSHFLLLLDEFLFFFYFFFRGGLLWSVAATNIPEYIRVTGARTGQAFSVCECDTNILFWFLTGLGWSCCAHEMRREDKPNM